MARRRVVGTLRNRRAIRRQTASRLRRSRLAPPFGTFRGGSGGGGGGAGAVPDVTQHIEEGTTSPGTSFVTSSIAWAGSGTRLCIVFTTQGHSTTEVVEPSVSGAGLTWTPIDLSPDSSRNWAADESVSHRKSFAFGAIGTPTDGAVTVTWNVPTGGEFAQVRVFEVIGGETSNLGAAVPRAYARGDELDESALDTTVYAAEARDTNSIYLAHGTHGDPGTTTTPDSEWTQLGTNLVSGALKSVAAWKQAGDGDHQFTFSWTNTLTHRFGHVLELAAAGSPASNEHQFHYLDRKQPTSDTANLNTNAISGGGPDRAQLLFVASRRNNASVASVNSVTGAGLTWTVQDDAQFTVGTMQFRITLVTAVGQPDGTAATIAFSNGASRVAYQWYEVSGTDPATPFAQFKSAFTVGATSLAATFDAAPALDSTVFAIFARETAIGATGPQADSVFADQGYYELQGPDPDEINCGRMANTSADVQFCPIVRFSDDSTPSANWTATKGCGVVAVELV